MAGRAVGVGAVVLSIVALGCSGGRGLDGLRSAVADRDDGETVGALAQLKDAEGVDEEGLEEMLLELRHSEDWQVRDYCYVVGFARRLPAFVKLHDEFVSSDIVSERIIVASHPMSVEDSLLMLDDQDVSVRLAAMTGSYSLRGVDVEPIVRKGLLSSHEMVQYDAVGLAHDRGVTSVAPEVVALLEREGHAFVWLDDRIVDYVRRHELVEYYDEVQPFAEAKEKRHGTSGAFARDYPEDFGSWQFPPEMVGPVSRE